jgi:hypothetical protein
MFCMTGIEKNEDVSQVNSFCESFDLRDNEIRTVSDLRFSW